MLLQIEKPYARVIYKKIIKTGMGDLIIDETCDSNDGCILLENIGHGRDIFVRVPVEGYFELSKNRGGGSEGVQNTVRLYAMAWDCLCDRKPAIDECIEKRKSGDVQAELVICLASQLKLSISKGYKLVDIRKYWVPPDSSKEVPTKLGVSLKFAEFRRLFDDGLKDRLDELVSGL